MLFRQFSTLSARDINIGKKCSEMRFAIMKFMAGIYNIYLCRIRVSVDDTVLTSADENIRLFCRRRFCHFRGNLFYRLCFVILAEFFFVLGGNFFS